MKLPLFQMELFDFMQTASQVQSICKATTKPDLDARKAGTSGPQVFFHSVLKSNTIN